MADGAKRGASHVEDCGVPDQGGAGSVATGQTTLAVVVIRCAVIMAVRQPTIDKAVVRCIVALMVMV